MTTRLATLQHPVMLTYSTKKHGYALALAPKRFYIGVVYVNDSIWAIPKQGVS